MGGEFTYPKMVPLVLTQRGRERSEFSQTFCFEGSDDWVA